MVAGLQEQQPTDVEAAFFGHASKHFGGATGGCKLQSGWGPRELMVYSSLRLNKN